jgi:UDP-glucose:(heptosyl)LPS alpha-1,3-glucosyltransferase
MVADELVRYYAYPATRISVIHNGVDLERFQPPTPEERRRLRVQQGVPEGEFVFFLAGSGFWRKGVDIAIDLVAELRRRGAPVHLFIAGKAEDRRFEAQAQRSGSGASVRFLGPQPPNTMLSWYQMADLFLFPTRYDPFSNACLEAAACGLPVVTSESNGFQEVVVESETGLILKQGESVQQAAARIQEFLNHLPDPERVRRSVEHLNFESHVQKLLNTLQALGPRGEAH